MALTTDFEFDVFLSHNEVDRPRVRRLAERLKAPRFGHSTMLFRDPTGAGRPDKP